MRFPSRVALAHDPSPIFTGREHELARLRRGLRDVSLATIFGIEGMGKSALARRIAQEWDGPVVWWYTDVEPSLAELVDGLRRALAPDGEALARASEEDGIEDLARRLDASGGLAVIEDADRLGERAAALLALLAERLGRGRAIATGRVRIQDRASGPERVEIVLGGLDARAARELWTRLDDLYGVRTGFELALQRTGGSPLYLRRAHAGGLDEADPVGATVASLAPAERRAALVLALMGMPFPRDLASRAAGVRSAVGGLVAKLVVETTADGALALHDLFRESLKAIASPEELVAAHAVIADALDGCSLDLVTVTRLRVRHLAAAGKVRAARDLLLARVPELVRKGAVGDLVRSLDLVTRESDVEARLARARLMARLLELERAFGELQALGADRAEPGSPLRASFAHVAMLTRRLAAAEQASRAGLEAPAISPELRVRFATVYVIAATCRGDGEAARAAIERATTTMCAQARAVVAFARALSLWLEERDDEAEQAMHLAFTLFEDEHAFRAHVLAPTFMVTVLARVGKTAEATVALHTAETAVARSESPMMQLSLQALRATLRESAGDYASALADALAVERAFSRAGHHLGALWARLVRARVTLYAGQVRAGRRLLEELVRDADDALLITQLAARASRADPWVAITGPAPDDSARPGPQRRNRVIAVLRALAARQLAVARGYLAVLDPAGLDPLERALVEIARWAIDGASAGEPQLAYEAAARAGADPELAPAIAAWLRERIASSPDRPARLIVVDRRSHTLEREATLIRLEKRPALRRLLYMLLEAPGRAYGKRVLARAIWGTDYHPAHDGALWVNVKRLRMLVAPAGLGIAQDDEGVRLHVEAGCEVQSIAP